MIPLGRPADDSAAAPVPTDMGSIYGCIPIVSSSPLARCTINVAASGRPSESDTTAVPPVLALRLHLHLRRTTQQGAFVHFGHQKPGPICGGRSPGPSLPVIDHGLVQSLNRAGSRRLVVRSPIVYRRRPRNAAGCIRSSRGHHQCLAAQTVFALPVIRYALCR